MSVLTETETTDVVAPVRISDLAIPMAAKSFVLGYAHTIKRARHGTEDAARAHDYALSAAADISTLRELGYRLYGDAFDRLVSHLIAEGICADPVAEYRAGQKRAESDLANGTVWEF